VGRRVRVSSQATTHERQSVRRRRLRATDACFTKIMRTTNEREPGAEDDKLARLTGRDFELATELARDDLMEPNADAHQ
jgi:hypothetical protein